MFYVVAPVVFKKEERRGVLAWRGSKNLSLAPEVHNSITAWLLFFDGNPH